jgi:heme A synthase
METTNYETYLDQAENAPKRPDFLKILCILSFIACGLLMMLCLLGTMVLSLDQTMVDQAWVKVVESNPQFEEVDPMTFMHGFGMWCVYMLIATTFSLIGVIMMWRLEKIGFFIYVIAELSTHFIKLDMGTPENQSYGGLAFGVLIDLVFIFLYMRNLKYVNNKNNNTIIQSGS